MRLVDVEQVYCADCEYKGKCVTMIEQKTLFCDVPSMPTVEAVPVEAVAKMFFDFTGDSCPCNFNDNEEWLPFVCGQSDDCPNHKNELDCWKQYVKYYGERKDGAEDG